ncbi:MAG: SDR family oxidoreductase [Cyanobacteriota bacterium]|nr:SDR family oxidoreductase [Cyanobacteriota bacterium]
MFAPDLLQGRRLLITGASSGVGAATARLCSALGARLVLVGRDQGRLEALAASLPGGGHRWQGVDLAVADALHDLIRDLPPDWRPLHGAFHGAGLERLRPARLSRQADLEAVMAVATGGALALGRAAAGRDLFAAGAALVLMGSVAARCGSPGMAAYGAAHGAIEAMARCLASELAPRAIRVNVLLSGAVDTPMHRRICGALTPEGVEEYRQRHPLGFGTADDVAAMATFLLSPGGRWITGSAIVIDGGYSAR